LPSCHASPSGRGLPQQAGFPQALEGLPDDGVIDRWIQLRLQELPQLSDCLPPVAALPNQGGGAIELVRSVSLEVVNHQLITNLFQ
jgi:hypothetical protein